MLIMAVLVAITVVWQLHWPTRTYLSTRKEPLTVTDARGSRVSESCPGYITNCALQFRRLRRSSFNLCHKTPYQLWYHLNVWRNAYKPLSSKRKSLPRRLQGSQMERTLGILSFSLQCCPRNCFVPVLAHPTFLRWMGYGCFLHK